MRKTVCKGRDAKGRIKRGYRLTRGGLVRSGRPARRRARRRANGAAAAPWAVLPSGVRL